jgi:16S rRNA U1498 N3-methylase RsmE
MHQLFILDHFSKKGNQIFLFNVPELLFQLRKVLRATLGETLFVQPENGAVRYEIKLTYRTDRDLVGEIIECVTFAGNECLNNVTVHSVMMFIAMPNKREKAALIVQKLSEIGVDQI